LEQWFFDYFNEKILIDEPSLNGLVIDEKVTFRAYFTIYTQKYLFKSYM